MNGGQLHLNLHSYHWTPVYLDSVPHLKAPLCPKIIHVSFSIKLWGYLAGFFRFLQGMDTLLPNVYEGKLWRYFTLQRQNFLI